MQTLILKARHYNANKKGSDEYGTIAQFGDAVEDKADPALAAVRSHEVHAAVVAAHVARATLVYICERREAGEGVEDR